MAIAQIVVKSEDICHSWAVSVWQTEQIINVQQSSTYATMHGLFYVFTFACACRIHLYCM